MKSVFNAMSSLLLADIPAAGRAEAILCKRANDLQRNGVARSDQRLGLDPSLLDQYIIGVKLNAEQELRKRLGRISWQ